MPSPFVSILLVEDHTLFRDGLRALLEKSPELRVVGEAGGGEEGIKLASKSQPDIVVMDIAMPGLNGIEATRRILDTVPGSRVIILSMHKNREYIFEAFRAGASGYLIKDAAFTELAQAIADVRAGRTFLSASISQIVKDDYIQRARTESVNEGLTLLTSREREVLVLVAEGFSSSEIARDLRLSVHTVETHRRHIMEKLKIDSVVGLTKFAIRHGLSTLE